MELCALFITLIYPIFHGFFEQLVTVRYNNTCMDIIIIPLIVPVSELLYHNNLIMCVCQTCSYIAT